MTRHLAQSLRATACLLALAFAFALCSYGAVAWADDPASDEAAAAEASEAAKAPEASDEASSASASSSAAAATTNANIVDPTQRADNSFIYDTSIGSLFDQASLYDDRIVQVEGEVIGDRIADTSSPGYCWIMLTSFDDEDKSSISVHISNEQADQIDRYGRYGVTGTHFQVRGVYQQACPDHEGLSDIHATASGVISPGVDHPDEFNPSDFSLPLVLIAIGIVLLFAFRFVRERMR
ncbi:MAG: hydrolase [Eggerthellaceae bacterium]|nr:hydrolase [Eggerthellaceae bacterium]